ncbi:MAG: YjgP/YjgQ family permease [Deltaproteobacteria bacterium]|nr:MAG: YjgP/YjgQ family permease [Deltaproteobacteria bacterium]
MARGGQRPGGQLDRLLLGELSRLFFATLGGVVLVYLVIDFADRAHTYTGRAWGRAAAELYANKAAVVAYQLAPVALIIAAALLMTLLSRHGELTALFALGVRPLRLAAPIAAFAAVLGVALVWLGERVVVGADARAEEIQVTRFNRWGDWATYHAGSSWVRGKFGRIYHLGPQRDGGWEPATVLEIAQPFRLSRRIDARRIESAGPGRWRLFDAVETRYELYGGPGGTIFERRVEVLIELFPETPADLLLRSGRPRQLPWRQLREQVRLREKAGQPTREYEVALAERVATPVHMVPAALAAVGLTFTLRRPRRRMPLAGAVALGMALSLILWAASVISHSIAVSGAIAPWIGAAIPGVVCAAIAAITLLRA